MYTYKFYGKHISESGGCNIRQPVEQKHHLADRDSRQDDDAATLRRSQQMTVPRQMTLTKHEARQEQETGTFV